MLGILLENCSSRHRLHQLRERNALCHHLLVRVLRDAQGAGTGRLADARLHRFRITLGHLTIRLNADRHAAVHEDDLARDERRLVGGEERVDGA
jgi:hypothetical protein